MLNEHDTQDCLINTNVLSTHFPGFRAEKKILGDKTCCSSSVVCVKFSV